LLVSTPNFITTSESKCQNETWDLSFGITTILKGAYELLNANVVVELGNNGKLHVVVRTGQIIIPLSEIHTMTLSGSRFSSTTPEDIEKSRWVTISTRDGV
jgi:hypothetical protein